MRLNLSRKLLFLTTLVAGGRESAGKVAVGLGPERWGDTERRMWKAFLKESHFLTLLIFLGEEPGL